jgi:hypothetical protein
MASTPAFSIASEGIGLTDDPIPAIPEFRFWNICFNAFGQYLVLRLTSVTAHFGVCLSRSSFVPDKALQAHYKNVPHES